MEFPTLGDGRFNGFQIKENHVVDLFFSTNDRKNLTLTLLGVKRLKIEGVREGNIVFDVVIRSAARMSPSEYEELFGAPADPSKAENLLESARKENLSLLEMSSSYGADGMALFKDWKVQQD